MSTNRATKGTAPSSSNGNEVVKTGEFDIFTSKTRPQQQYFTPPVMTASSSTTPPPKRKLPPPKSSSSSSLDKAKLRRTFLGLIVAAAFTMAIVTSVILVSSPKPARLTKRNVIFMLADGYGPASATFARSYFQYLEMIKESKGNENEMNFHQANHSLLLPLDDIWKGTIRTHSFDSRVTDSAASATAYSCGLKTLNYVVGCDAQLKPCPSILSLAKVAGYQTGLVVTSRVTHATPAAFTAHVPNRNMENDIAKFQMGLGDDEGQRMILVPDVIMGGGRCHFLPQSVEGSCRKDDLDLLKVAREMNIQVFEDFNELVQSQKKNAGGGLGRKLLGLFKLDHMNYEIDRNVQEQGEPSLWEMTLQALDHLSSLSDRDSLDERETQASTSSGFFLLVEGSRIDMAAHSNDAVSHYHDIMAYQDTVARVRQWIRKRHQETGGQEETILISLADHETGGLALNRHLPDDVDNFEAVHYDWWPWNLAGQLNSTLVLARYMAAHMSPHPIPPSVINDTIIGPLLGIKDATIQELTLLSNHSSNPAACDKLMATMKSKRALLGWSTFGHSAVDVNLYVEGSHSLRDGYEFRGFRPTSLYRHTLSKLAGSLDNTEINEILVRYLGLESFRMQQRASLERSWIKKKLKGGGGGAISDSNEPDDETLHFHI